jgi:hypothetical protein
VYLTLAEPYLVLDSTYNKGGTYTLFYDLDHALRCDYQFQRTLFILDLPVADHHAGTRIHVPYVVPFLLESVYNAGTAC